MAAATRFDLDKQGGFAERALLWQMILEVTLPWLCPPARNANTYDQNQDFSRDPTSRRKKRTEVEQNLMTRAYDVVRAKFDEYFGPTSKNL